jgi:hypothetical protein
MMLADRTDHITLDAGIEARPGGSFKPRSQRNLRRRFTGLLLRYPALVLIVGCVLTVGGLGYSYHKPGLFWSVDQVVFLGPRSSANPNSLLIGTDGVTATAGIVAKMVDPNDDPNRVVSPSVFLIDEGIRDGWAVNLPDTGGQWAHNFERSVLTVQVVNPVASVVVAKMKELIQRVTEALGELQDRYEVARVNRITTYVTNAEPPLYYNQGSKVRRLAIVLIIGAGITYGCYRETLRRARRERRAM